MTGSAYGGSSRLRLGCGAPSGFARHITHTPQPTTNHRGYNILLSVYCRFNLTVVSFFCHPRGGARHGHGHVHTDALPRPRRDPHRVRGQPRLGPPSELAGASPPRAASLAIRAASRGLLCVDAARAACIARRSRGPWHPCRGRAAHATGQPAAARRAARRVQCTATPAAWAKRRPAAGRTEAEGGPAQGLRGAPAVAPRAILGAHMPTRAWLRAQMRRAARLASS